MSPTRPSRKPSSDLRTPPEGKVLKVNHALDGYSTVRLDNGIPHTLTILTRSEDFPALMGSDLADIRAHLMSRHTGHFRSKK
jgi:hypothetical protein